MYKKEDIFVYVFLTHLVTKSKINLSHFNERNAKVFILIIIGQLFIEHVTIKGGKTWLEIVNS